MRVAQAVIDLLMAEAERAAPEECCGLLLGQEVIEEARPMANVAADARREFEINPQALVDAHRAARDGGPQVVGYYHSHPRGPSTPSATDRACAAGDGKVWAIMGLDGVTFWRDDEDGFVSLSYTVEDR